MNPNIIIIFIILVFLYFIFFKNKENFELDDAEAIFATNIFSFLQNADDILYEDYINLLIANTNIYSNLTKPDVFFKLKALSKLKKLKIQDVLNEMVLTE